MTGVNLLEEPAVRGFVVNARNITERKRAEAELRESEARERRRAAELQAIMEAVPAAVFIAVDPECLTMLGSRRTYDLLRLPQGSNLSKSGPEGERPTHFRVMQDGIEVPPAELPVQKAAATGRTAELAELDLVFDDGTMHRLLGNAVPLLDENGRPYGAVGAYIDITERKRAEEALQESEQRFKALSEVTPIGAGISSMDGVLRYTNPAFERIVGYGPGEMVGTKASDIWWNAEDRNAWLNIMKKDGVVRDFQAKLRKKDGTAVWGSMGGAPIVFGSEPGVMGTIQDITKRKRAEEVLVRRTDDLIRLNHEVKAARDETNMYLDIITHDVRNANNVSEHVRRPPGRLLAGDQWLYARKLRDAIQRSSEILRNVATIRRLQQESDRLIPMNLDAIIKEEIENFPGASIQFDGRRVDVLADGLLPVIFTNLIGNAVKFSGPDVEIVIGFEEQNGEVRVSVEDTGPGVPDEMKEKLFTRFERGVARGKGEGLGLYIVRTLVKRYGGRTWVDDRVPGRPEEGAAFRFTLQKVA